MSDSSVTFSKMWDLTCCNIEKITLSEARLPDSIATVVNSLQNRVNSITLCITLDVKKANISFSEKLLKIVATRGEIF